MVRFRWLLFFALIVLPSVSRAQDTLRRGDKGWTELEKTLQDVDNQWICAYRYHQNHVQDCVEKKSQLWPDKFFEISRQGDITDKQEMVKRQTATATKHPDSPGDAGPNPKQFELKAVYGNVALATDHTVFKAADANGKIVVTDEANVLRVFVKLDGKWRPAAAALVPTKSP